MMNLMTLKNEEINKKIEQENNKKFPNKDNSCQLKRGNVK